MPLIRAARCWEGVNTSLMVALALRPDTVVSVRSPAFFLQAIPNRNPRHKSGTFLLLFGSGQGERAIHGVGVSQHHGSRYRSRLSRL